MVPEAEPLVSAFRARFAAASVARRLPAHITLLIPFVAAAEFDDEGVAAAREHFGSVARFDAEVIGSDRFAEDVRLAPSPRHAFVELIRATCRRFPESPYGGEFPEPVPHLTIGRASPGVCVTEIARAAEAEIAPSLPVRFRVAAARLLVEQVDGTWTPETELPLGP